MKGCDPQRLQALHDGVLAGADRDLVERHVSTCPACSRTLDEWRRIDALARDEIAVPSGYFDGLPARIAARARAPQRRAAWARPAAWAGALAAAALIAVVTPRLLDSPVVPDPRPVPSTTPAANPERQRAELAERTASADRESREPERSGAPKPPSLSAEFGAEASARQAVPARETAQRPVETDAGKRQVSVPETRAARMAAPAAGAAPQAPLAAELTAPPADESRGRKTEALAVATSAEPPVGLADEQKRAVASASEAPPANSSAAGFAAKSAPSTPPPPLRLQRARAERDRLSLEARRARVGTPSLRRAVEAAADAVRAGGDLADRAALEALVKAYSAVADEGERARVQRLLQELLGQP